MSQTTDPTPSYQLGYSDAMKYGIPRNLRDFPNGTLQTEYNAGYKAAERKMSQTIKNTETANAGQNSALTFKDIQSLFWSLINKAIRAKLIDNILYERPSFLQRARRAAKANLAEPGDCKGDTVMLIALALAEAQVGKGPGWIPETQRIAYTIAKLND